MIGIQLNAGDGVQATGQTPVTGGAIDPRSDADRDWSAIWQREMNRDADRASQRDAGRELNREMNHDATHDATRKEARRDDGSDTDCFQGLLPGGSMPLPPLPSSADGAASVATGPSLANAVARAAQDDPSAGSAMRLHAEWSATGVRLWIGASLNDQAGMILLGRPLRAGLERQGVRLLSLVCNGQIIYADALASKADHVEAPQPPTGV